MSDNMSNNRKVQIGLAVGWFVIIEALLATSSASLSTLGVATGSLRGIFTSVMYNRPFRPEFSALLLALLIGLAALVIASVLRAWTQAIVLTRSIVEYMLLDPDGNSGATEKLLIRLFGEEPLNSRHSVAWRLLGSLALVWLLVLLFQLSSGVLAVMYSL